MLDFNISNKYSDALYIDNDVDFVLQQIDMLFDTDSNEVLGDPNFGTNYERYLYNLNIGNSSIEQKIYNDIMNLDLRGFNVSVDVHIVEGTIHDIVFVDIILHGNYGEFARSYVIN